MILFKVGDPESIVPGDGTCSEVIPYEWLGKDDAVGVLFCIRTAGDHSQHVATGFGKVLAVKDGSAVNEKKHWWSRKAK